MTTTRGILTTAVLSFLIAAAVVAQALTAAPMVASAQGDSGYCGDGIVTAGEECDDGNARNGDACRNDCRTNVCGDGYLNRAAEECDDGNRNGFDGCTNDCTVCGDGNVRMPEECDDGNTTSGDGCDGQCRFPHVVGTGTAESCTEAALDAALAGGGTVTFDCGPEPVTITVTATKAIAQETSIDGRSLITVSGGSAVGVFHVNEGATFRLRNLTIANGSADNGAAIDSVGTVVADHCSFVGNRAGLGAAVSGGGVC